MKIYKWMYYSLSILLFTVLASLAVNAQEKITLQSAVDRTLANNLTIKQAQVTESIGGLELQQAKNNLLPNLNASTQGGYNFGRSQVAGSFTYTSSTSLNVNGNAQLQFTVYQGAITQSDHPKQIVIGC
ncbi:TolC family protein [Mucilaginibacter antarcticus]|uniref:TolC family protein n=1 Tax=Mucilaginibacter antarcticus TaxID=1855725 RepID=UPI00363E6CDE